jgi:murein L,D-transpeptidase YcbB/YkuD
MQMEGSVRKNRRAGARRLVWCATLIVVAVSAVAVDAGPIEDRARRRTSRMTTEPATPSPPLVRPRVEPERSLPSAPVEQAQPVQASVVADTEVLRSVVGRGRHPYLRAAAFADVADAVRAAYEATDFQPLWLHDGVTSRVGGKLVRAIESAHEYGLDPEHYDSALLIRKAARLDESPPDAPEHAHEAAMFDVALTVSTLRFLSDLRFGRARPAYLRAREGVGARTSELLDALTRMRSDGRVIYEIATLEPRTAQYVQLRQALAQYRRLTVDVGFVHLPIVPVVKPGERYIGTAELRRLLRAIGDLHSDEVPEDPDLYVSPLVEAVRRFQARHGLAADGVIGAETFAQLGTPLAWRTRQIELSMERYRWAWAPQSGPYVLINIPAFNLTAFRSVAAGGFPDLEMEIIVGESVERHQTPVFTADMRYVVFRPYWNVPYRIAVSELVPAIRRDPGYLEKQNLEIVARYDDTEPLPATDANIARVGRGGLSLRQRPGPDNALGLVKFIFPNPYDVYLHSTPARSLFARRRRDFSHGCMRIENPQALAEFVLEGDGEWTPQGIRAAMESGRNGRWVSLSRPVPVLVLYATAGIEPDGTVLFFADIYGRDAALDEHLSIGSADEKP